jgi:predicted phosphodiesterase
VSLRRVAALYDIHANLPALEAVLDEISHSEIDLIVMGGDVLPGPMPRETLACLAAMPIPAEFIYGNGEAAVLEQMSGKEPAAVPEAFRPIIRWTARQLTPADARRISGWPKTLCLEIGGLGSVVFCHATPRDENEIFTRLTPAERLLPIFEPAGAPVADVAVCGHTHMQFDRTIGGTRVVNAGSVGMAFGAPGADWLLLGPGVELRHTDYDIARAASRIRSTPYPDAEAFAARHVVAPPSEAQMLEIFARAELK